MKIIERILATPRRRQLAISGGILGAALLTSASIFATGPNASPAEHVEKAWPVSVTTVRPQTLHPNFSAFGRLESNQIASLRSDLVVQIDVVHVKEGDWANAGDMLVKLDDRETKLRVIEREADLRQEQANLAAMHIQFDLEQQSAEQFESKFEVAQAKLTRHEDLMEKRLISKSLLDEVTAQSNQASIDYRNHVRELTSLPSQISAREAGVVKAEALLQQARLDLEKTTIRAPFSGPVLAVFAAPGNHSNLNTPLVEIADASGYEVRVQIPDAYAEQFYLAQSEATERITAVAESGARLTLARLASQVRTGQTGMDAFFVFDQANEHAPALGRVFNLSIELPAQAQLIAVPVQSIYENNRVYAVRDGRLVGHDIERVGEQESAEHGYQILIRTGEIQPGDDVITTQLPRAITGLLVDVANRSKSESG
jgi:multidrug efflux pump subunit AcrA (membrane-fusion protein)